MEGVKGIGVAALLFGYYSDELVYVRVVCWIVKQKWNPIFDDSVLFRCDSEAPGDVFLTF